MAPDELKALLERVGAGEEAACRALYLRYRPSVSRLLEGFAQLDDDEREDLVQETFTRAFRAVKGVKAAEAFEGWLLTIARNRALSALSRKSTQRELKERLSTEQSEETGFIPEALQLELEVDVVRKLIDALPEGPEKETVRLFYVEGELSPAVCARMEKHVASCPACNGACESLRAVLGACRTYGSQPVPPRITLAVRTAVKDLLAKR